MQFCFRSGGLGCRVVDTPAQVTHDGWESLSVKESAKAIFRRAYKTPHFLAAMS